MIAELLVQPQSQDEWAIWAWHHRSDHADIIAAIRAQKNVQLQDFPIEPIPFDKFNDWLENNSQMHRDMNTTLGLQASDLDEVNPREQQEFGTWIFQHWLEHSAAREALKI